MDAQLNITICHPRLSSGQDSNTAVVARSLLPAVLPVNHVLIKVERFGYSANNVTYQALGEVPDFRYFDFHKAPDVPESGVSPSTHGVTPVWGFGTVIASTDMAIRPGERIYGYVAPTRFLVLPVSAVNPYVFTVSRPHFPEDRKPYNIITRCSMDPLYDPSPSVEDLAMLYRPLFWTSFWCEDWMNTSQYRGGATRILISSASAKTAFCLAYLIRKRGATLGNGGPTRRVVGLTSQKNAEFTKRLGLYDHVLEYDEFEKADVMREPLQKWIYFDVASNENLNSRIWGHFLDAKLGLVGAVALGFTNLSPSSKDNPVEKRTKSDFSSQKVPSTLELFFMPEWFARRRKELSVEQITRLQKEAWTGLMQDCRGWGITIRRVYGADNVKKAYEEVVRGGFPPNEGFIWSLWDHDTVNARL